MSLRKDEFTILQHLFLDPNTTYSKIAENVDLSPPTVKKRVDSLFEKNILRGFKAEYYPEALGLESHIFLLNVESKDKLQVVERVLQLHPYIVLVRHLFGAMNGLILKCHIPIDSVTYFIQFLNHLKNQDLIVEIVHSTTIGKGIKTRLDLSYWDPKKERWTFDWELWEKNIDSIDYVPRSNFLQRIMKEKKENILTRMQYNDFLILEELLDDISKKNTEIAQKLDIPEYTLSRRMQFLKKYIIRNYLVEYNRSFFKLEDYFIFKVICGNRAMTKIVYLLQNLPLPFDSDFRQTDDGFLWSIILPPQDKLQVINLLWSLFPALKIMVIDTRNSISKNLNPHNFSFRTLSWKDSYDYMVRKPLEKSRDELLIA